MSIPYIVLFFLQILFYIAIKRLPCGFPIFLHPARGAARPFHVQPHARLSFIRRGNRIKKEEYKELWKSIRQVTKIIFSSKEAKEIRNNIDAHKNFSFKTQISVYKKCEWTQSVFNLAVFIKLINELQRCMVAIKDNVKNIDERYAAEIKEYRVWIEEMIEKMESSIN